jgi:hypothetical protein
MCDAPPQRKKRMVDFAGRLRGARFAVPAAELPKLNPASPVADAAMNARRLRAGENSGAGMVGESDAWVGEVNQAARRQLSA